MDIPRTFSDAFKGKRAALVEKIDIEHSGLLNVMLDNDVIMRAQRQDCEAPATQREKISKLLDILERRPDSYFPAFCDCLYRTSQPHVVGILMSPSGSVSNSSLSGHSSGQQPYQPSQPLRFSSGFGAGAAQNAASFQYNPGMSAQSGHLSGGLSSSLTRLRTEILPPNVTIIPFNRLRSLRQIAEGGFGIIHEAVHSDWGTVAYKKLKATVINPNEKMARELQREAQAHVLRHPNIVSIMGVIFEPGEYGIVMEFAAHGGLDEFVHKYLVDIVMKMSMAQGIVNGMNYLHTQVPAVIHGDLKTQNVLIADGYVAKICDFGLSKWKQYSTIKTNSRSIRGTVTHIPPETWADINYRRTTKYDVYSFGILMYELLTENLAFQQAITDQIRLAVLAGNRPSLADLDEVTGANTHPADTIEKIKDMMKSFWAQNADDRPTFAEIMSTLETFVDERAEMLQAAKANLDAEVMQSRRP